MTVAYFRRSRTYHPSCHGQQAVGEEDAGVPPVDQAVGEDAAAPPADQAVGEDGGGGGGDDGGGGDGDGN